MKIKKKSRKSVTMRARRFSIFTESLIFKFILKQLYYTDIEIHHNHVTAEIRLKLRKAKPVTVTSSELMLPSTRTEVSENNSTSRSGTDTAHSNHY